MLPVEQPFKTYTGLDGKPLDNGYVWFGQPNQNPQTAPVTVFWDAAGTIPAAQPLRTVNGYIYRGGTPANVFFDGAYSELAWDSKRRQVFYARTSDEFSIATAVATFLKNVAGAAGAGLIGFTQLGIGAVLRTVYAKLLPTLDPEDFGAIGDGATDDTAAFAAMSAQMRARGGGTIRMGYGKTYSVLPTGGSSGNVLLDLSNCRGVTIQGNGATIKTGPVGLAQTCIDLNATYGVTIENLNFESTYTTLTGSAGIDWIVLRYGAKRSAFRNLNFKHGVSGIVSRGAYINQGVDTNRVSGIEATNCHFDSTYYPLLFQSAGDHFFGRGIVTRNAGRSYFPYNVHDHDVQIDSQQGGPFSDVLLKCYGTTAFYSGLENIRLVYTSDGRYPGSGTQGTDEAMIAIDLQLYTSSPAPCKVSNIDIQFNVSASASDKNQSVFTVRKYDGTGVPDTIGRGHNLINFKLSGIGRNLQNLSAASINMFSRPSENWTGEFAYLLQLSDLYLGNVSSQNALLLNGAPIVGACHIARALTPGGLVLSNVGGKEIYIDQSAFYNYSARSRITQSYPIAWTADGSAPNVGSGTLAGSYTVQGKLCTANVLMKAVGDTNFGTGIWHFSLPLPHYGGAQPSTGSAMSLHAGANYYTGNCVVQTGATTMEVIVGGSPGNFANSASPVAWASGDYIQATITYPIE